MRRVTLIALGFSLLAPALMVTGCERHTQAEQYV